MYWLYYSFIVMYPIYSMLAILIMGYLDTGSVISTDTFYAVMQFQTSHACPKWVFDLIGCALTEAGYVWLMLVVHTIASTSIDIMNVCDRRHDL